MNAAIAFSTRARVELLTGPVLFRTRDTVEVDTRARRATRSKLMKSSSHVRQPGRSAECMKEIATFLLLVVLCTVVAVINPRFLSLANLQNTARLIGAFGIFSLGLGLVIITRGIDLSVGSAFALLGVLLSMLLTTWHLPWPAAVLIIIALGALLSTLATASSSRGCTCSRSSPRCAACSSLRPGAVHRQ